MQKQQQSKYTQKCIYLNKQPKLGILNFRGSGRQWKESINFAQGKILRPKYARTNLYEEYLFWVKGLQKREEPARIRINLIRAMMLGLMLKKAIFSVLPFLLNQDFFNLLDSKIRLNFLTTPLPIRHSLHFHNESLNSYQWNARKPKPVITDFLYLQRKL